MLDTYLGIYCQGQNKISIVSSRELRMVGTKEDNSKQEN